MVVQILFVSFGMLVFVGYSLIIRSRRSLVEKWSKSAQQLGFTDVKVKGSLWPAMTGRRKDMYLAVHSKKTDSNYSGTVILINAPGLLPDLLELRAESILTRMNIWKKDPDIEVGDTTFDDYVLVRGHPVLALALLNAENRKRVIDLVRRGCQINGPRLIMKVGHLLRDDEFKQELSNLIEFVRSLSNPKNPAELLARNALEDPLAQVRKSNLDMLVTRFGHHSLTTGVLRSALEDNSPEMRVTAATALGDEGIEVLENLLTDSRVPDSLKAEAIVGLGPRLSVERTIDILGDALRQRKRPLAFAAIEVLGVIASAPAVQRLVTVLGAGDDDLATAAAHIASAPAVQRLATMLGAGDKDFATAAAHALGNTGDPAATEALVNALDNPSRQVQLSVIDALGRVASTAAVLPLRSFIDDHFLDRKTHNLVTKAIAAIHDRATGAAAGQISLTEVDEGQLALAEDENGNLSLT